MSQMLRFFIKLCLFISVGVYPFIYVGLSGAPMMGCGGDSGAVAEEEDEENGNALATSDAAVSDGVSTAVTVYASSNLSYVLSFNLSPARHSSIKKTSSNGFECETEGDGASGTCTCPGGGTIVMDFEFDFEGTDDCEMPIDAVVTTTYTGCQMTSCGLTVTLNGTDTFSYGGTFFNRCTMEAELTGGISTSGGVEEDCTGITATLSSGESATACYDIDFEATSSMDFSLSGTFVISSSGATSEITFDSITDLQEQVGVVEACEEESTEDEDTEEESTDDASSDDTGSTTGTTSTSLTGFSGTYTASNTSCTQSSMNTSSNYSVTLSGSNPYEVTTTGQSMSWLTINLASSSCIGTTVGMGSCSSCSYTGTGSAGSQIIATCPVSMAGDTCVYTFTKQ